MKLMNCDTEQGFFFGKTEDGLNLQCCLTANGTLDTEDTGYDWGICLDANDDAFEKYGKDACLAALIAAAKEQGLKIK